MKNNLIIILFILLFISSPVHSDTKEKFSHNYKFVSIEKGKGYEYGYYENKMDRILVFTGIIDLDKRNILIDNYKKPVSYEVILKKHSPLFLINGGYYSIDNNKYKTLGIVRGMNGTHDYFKRKWYILSVDKKNRVRISHYSKSHINSKSVKFLLQSKPQIIRGGKVSSRTKNKNITRRIKNPRTGIGVNKNKLFLFVVEGRTERSSGMTLLEFAEFMKYAGVKEGLNLDGGGSSFMVFKNSLKNIPSGGFSPFTFQGEVRKVLNCIIVK